MINRVLVNYSSIARGVVGKCSAALRKLKRNFQPKRVQRVNEAIKLVRNSRLFDSAFYLSTYPDLAAAAIDPAEHYFLCGATEGRNPGPLFSTSEYLQQNPDVATAKLNALYHYEFRGREEGRLLRSPLTDEAIDIIRRSSLFDLGFYLRTYPDLAVAGVDSAMHYFRHGAEEGRNPGPLFFTSEYLLRNPDVALANVNPLYHYETQGREEKRPMRLHQHEAIELIRSSPLFDPEFYLSVYPDLAASAVDPAAHYFLHGAEEGRNPGPLFFTSEYLRQNPDVAAANMNALYHYESRGREEGRPVPRQQAVPLSEHSEMRRRLIEALGYYRYITCHPDLEGPGQSPLDISVSAVIPTYNAGSELGPLVRKLLAQKGLKSVEVVIVDSGSTDGTAEFSVELGCKLVKINQAEFSHSYSRNVGADASTGELLVFMVQDAYPIGEYWLFGLARCLFRPQVKEAQLSAVSCAEYPRVASELFYDNLSKRHYEFIGCSGKDRVGYLSSYDYVSLRMQGQLSDVACAIPTEIFKNYRYIGSYGEDLTLGIRLIRDGHLVGMLSSISVIHSHNREAYYYLRRAFVDNLFLYEIFPDHGLPENNCLSGTLVCGLALWDKLRLLPNQDSRSPVKILEDYIAEITHTALPGGLQPLNNSSNFDNARMGSWIKRVNYTAIEHRWPFDELSLRTLRQTQSMFIGRLSSLLPFIEISYPILDDLVAVELSDAIKKSLAMTIGLQLAYCCLRPRKCTDYQQLDELLRELKPIMMAGV